MKKLFLTALMAICFACSMIAQNVIFTIVKTDGTSASYEMSSDAKIYYSDTQLFLKSNGETVSYNLSELRKAYFSEPQDVAEVESKQLAIFPNPAKDVLRIKNITDNQLVTIYSINGAIVKKTIVSGDSAIDISDLNTGLYIIGVGNEFSKFIKM